MYLDKVHRCHTLMGIVKLYDKIVVHLNTFGQSRCQNRYNNNNNYISDSQVCIVHTNSFTFND